VGLRAGSGLLTLIVQPLDLADGLGAGRSVEQTLGVQPYKGKSLGAFHSSQHLGSVAAPAHGIPPEAGEALRTCSSSPNPS
jgi:hypothetical protein